MALRRSRWPRKKVAAPFDDFRDALNAYVLPGYIPSVAPLTRSDIIVTQGSCFAEELRTALAAQDIETAYMSVGEEINSPLANWLFFDYAVNGTPYRSAEHATAMAPHVLDSLRKVIGAAAAMVLTMGVAFCPFRDGELTMAVSIGYLSKVTWRLTTVEENAGYLHDIIDLARKIRPDLLIIVSVSPIPLKNSFLHDSPVVADCLSKSTLRLAVDQVMSLKLPGVYYWPSFEAFRWVGAHHGKVFGIEGTDSRHIGQSYIDQITKAFIESFIA